MRRKVNSGSKSKDFSVVPLRLPPRLSRASPARWPPSPTCRTHALRGAASCHAHALQFCPFVPPHLSTQPTPRSHIAPRPSSLNLPSVIRRTIAIQTHHHAVPPMAPRCPCRLPVRDDRCRPAHDATRSGWPSLALSSLYTLYPLPFVRSPSHCSTVLYPCAALSFIHPAPNHHGFHSAPSTRSCHVTCCSTDVITSPRRRVPASGLAQVTIACHSNFPVSLQTWVAPGNGTGAVTEFPCNSSDTFLINVAGATEFQLVYHKAVEQQKKRAAPQGCQEPATEHRRERVRSLGEYNVSKRRRGSVLGVHGDSPLHPERWRGQYALPPSKSATSCWVLGPQSLRSLAV